MIRTRGKLYLHIRSDCWSTPLLLSLPTESRQKKEYLNGLYDLRWSTTTKKRVWVNQRYVLPVKFVALPRTAVVEEREGGGGGSWAKQPLVFPDLRNVVGERAGAFHHKGVYKITASSAKYNIPHKHTYVAIFNWF